MSLKDIPVGQQVALAGALASSALAYLSIKYHDRPTFYEHSKDIPYVKGYPLLGNLPSLLSNIERIYDYQLDMFEKMDVLTL